MRRRGGWNILRIRTRRIVGKKNKHLLTIKNSSIHTKKKIKQNLNNGTPCKSDSLVSLGYVSERFFLDLLVFKSRPPY